MKLRDKVRREYIRVVSSADTQWEAAVIDYAETYANLVEQRIKEVEENTGYKPTVVSVLFIDGTEIDTKANHAGITNNQYIAAMQLLVKYWFYGKELNDYLDMRAK